eukprot:5677781-Prymnesium_polylepis.1
MSRVLVCGPSLERKKKKSPVQHSRLFHVWTGSRSLRCRLQYAKYAKFPVFTDRNPVRLIVMSLSRC